MNIVLLAIIKYLTNNEQNINLIILLLELVIENNATYQNMT